MSNLRKPLLPVATGERQGSASAVQLPSVAGSLVNVKAVRSNAGNVYVGFASSVTAVNGTTDTTSGWELDAGEETGWLPLDNLDKLWVIMDNAGDDICYMVLG